MVPSCRLIPARIHIEKMTLQFSCMECANFIEFASFPGKALGTRMTVYSSPSPLTSRPSPPTPARAIPTLLPIVYARRASGV